MAFISKHKEKLRKTGAGFKDEYDRRQMSSFASSIAFFFFLSIVPLVILLVSLVPYTSLTLEQITEAAVELSPDIADELVVTVISEAYSSSHGLLPISVIVLILSSSQGTMAMIRGLNSAYQVEEKRNIIIQRLMSMLYTVVLLGLIAVMLYIIFGNYLLHNVISRLSEKDLPQSVYSVWHIILSLVLSVLLFSLIYTFVPFGRRNYLLQLPGAVFTSVSWSAFSFFFSLYINGMNKYTVFYGSLATVTIFLFWLYGCFFILLVGGFINCLFEPQIRRLVFREGAKRPGKEK